MILQQRWVHVTVKKVASSNPLAVVYGMDRRAKAGPREFRTAE